MKRATLVLAALALLLGGVGRAAADFSTQVVDYSISNSNGSTTLNFNRFDSTLGTLTNASFGYTANVTNMSVDFENRNSSPLSNVLIQAVENFSFGLPNNYGSNSNIIVLDTTHDFAGYDGTADFSGADTYAFSQTGTKTVTDTANPSDPSFSPAQSGFDYTGTGTFSVVVNTYGNHFAGSSDIHIQDNGTTETTGSLTLIYTYSPTATAPEPSGLALLGIGCVGLIGYAGLRRRKALTPPAA